MKYRLDGAVAVVAGATRGAGRGIALALGEAGAFVYCTGRSVRGNPSPYRRPETIEETAEMITAAGGKAVAVRVDHTVEAEVHTLFEGVREEHDRLDVLVNSIAGEDPVLGPWSSFWKADLSNAEAALRQSLVSHIITAKHAAELMIRRRAGVIVEVTEGDLLISGGSIMAQIIKESQKGLAAIWAAELKRYGVASIAVTPGFLRSERMLEHFGVTEANWRDAGAKDPNFVESESPHFVGRAIAALAADPKLIERTGQLFSSWEIGRTYGLTDVDGRRPDWGALDIDWSHHPAQLLRAFCDALEVQSRWLGELSERTERQLALLRPKLDARGQAT
jgi:NAD(P)-dependent dehydrogenase (short-subunit alcohol dehydrogenase family)